MLGELHLVANAARLAGLVALGWIEAVWIAGVVYVVVSYAEGHGRLPERPLLSTVHWALIELLHVMWSQPLMPIFQLFGERLGSGGGEVPIVLVHGYFQNRIDFLYLAYRLRKAGSGPIYAYNFFWPQHLETSSRQVSRFIERVRHETGAPAVDLLTHSTGGLFALDLAAAQPEAVRRIACIAIPARGVPWRGPVLGWSGAQLRTNSLYQGRRSNRVQSVPVLSAYSAHDNLVHPVSTSALEGPSVTNFEVQGPGHLSVLFNRAIAGEVVDFLVP
jgi:hypothetical protein